jgi:hypothetical protein
MHFVAFRQIKEFTKLFPFHAPCPLLLTSHRDRPALPNITPFPRSFSILQTPKTPPPSDDSLRLRY